MSCRTESEGKPIDRRDWLYGGHAPAVSRRDERTRRPRHVSTDRTGFGRDGDEGTKKAQGERAAVERRTEAEQFRPSFPFFVLRFRFVQVDDRRRRRHARAAGDRAECHRDDRGDLPTFGGVVSWHEDVHDAREELRRRLRAGGGVLLATDMRRAPVSASRSSSRTSGVVTGVPHAITANLREQRDLTGRPLLRGTAWRDLGRVGSAERGS